MLGCNLYTLLTTENTTRVPQVKITIHVKQLRVSAVQGSNFQSIFSQEGTTYGFI